MTRDEIERLIHEATPTIRQYLERNLPKDHPILLALAERWGLDLKHDQD